MIRMSLELTKQYVYERDVNKFRNLLEFMSEANFKKNCSNFFALAICKVRKNDTIVISKYSLEEITLNS